MKDKEQIEIAQPIESNAIYRQIAENVLNHLFQRYGSNPSYLQKVITALGILLGNKSKCYGFSLNHGTIHQADEFDIQGFLSKINEKGIKRKKAGVFYTDRDVTDFMVLNSFVHFIEPTLCTISGINTAKEYLRKLNENNINRLLKATIFDPTCGAGEFLVSALSQKINLFKLVHTDCIALDDLASTIQGNDIDSISTDITKIRLYLLLIDSFEGELNVKKIAKSISKSFYNVDAVDYIGREFGQYNIIVGNPPYIEYSKYDGHVSNKFGNVYADVMKNVVTLLTIDGILSFVVPLSYISTLRMKSIRDFVQANTGKQLLLNFADRPDCLFDGVHQKLNIVFAQKTKKTTGIYTSKYHHWYNSEREKLFDNLTLAKVESEEKEYWPKIGDDIALGIYDKIKAFKGDDLLSLGNSKKTGFFYLNLRACFWMKVFSHDMKSNSYKCYEVEKNKLPYVLCLLNSSLFFLVWTIVSDGWHITNKELSFIKIPTKIANPNRWIGLIEKLEEKLESTKEYVGTKQVEYEYKHKFCKDIIDEIDEELKSVYGLSETEVKYIKSFNEKYRVSDGA